MFNMTKYFDIIYCATEKRFGDQFCKHSASAYINKDIPAIQRGVCNLSPAALLLFLTHSAAFKPCTHSPCRSLTSQYYCRSGCSPKSFLAYVSRPWAVCQICGLLFVTHFETSWELQRHLWRQRIQEEEEEHDSAGITGFGYYLTVCNSCFSRCFCLDMRFPQFDLVGFYRLSR